MVWIPSHKCTGEVITEVTPRSYTVQTSQGTLRRNHRHLILSPSIASDDLDMIPDIPTSDGSVVEPPSNPHNSEPSADGTVDQTFKLYYFMVVT